MLIREGQLSWDNVGQRDVLKAWIMRSVEERIDLLCEDNENHKLLSTRLAESESTFSLLHLLSCIELVMLAFNGWGSWQGIGPVGST